MQFCVCSVSDVYLFICFIVECQFLCEKPKYAVQISALKVKVDLNLRDDCKPGPSCSKLTMSLVNDSLKFTSSDMQIC